MILGRLGRLWVRAGRRSAIRRNPAWPAALNAQSEELNALRDTLGDFNDLHVLATFATERASLEPEALAGLMARLVAKQKKLRRRAETEFDRLFAETPDAFSERLSAYLRRPMTKPKTGAPNDRKRARDWPGRAPTADANGQVAPSSARRRE